MTDSKPPTNFFVSERHSSSFAFCHYRRSFPELWCSVLWCVVGPLEELADGGDQAEDGGLDSLLLRRREREARHHRFVLFLLHMQPRVLFKSVRQNGLGEVPLHRRGHAGLVLAGAFALAFVVHRVRARGLREVGLGRALLLAPRSDREEEGEDEEKEHRRRRRRPAPQHPCHHRAKNLELNARPSSPHSLPFFLSLSPGRGRVRACQQLSNKSKQALASPGSSSPACLRSQRGRRQCCSGAMGPALAPP
mmetsp:Transcript_3853/g.8848  ORF Transcript_3853/g.8848 Transcript_3853/m.8848 type:complete len:250 (-) Transcript_3853:58-807(-)